MWGYEHIGRRVVVHTAVEAGHIGAVVVVPTGSVVGMAADHTVGEAVVDPIDSVVVLGLDTET